MNNAASTIAGAALWIIVGECTCPGPRGRLACGHLQENWWSRWPVRLP